MEGEEHFRVKLKQLDCDVRRLEEQVSLIKSAASDQASEIKAWKGYVQRRISDFVIALNENTAKDKASNRHVHQLQEVVKRLDDSEGAIKVQEIKSRQQRRSNIVLFGSLLIVSVLVIQGKIASGDIASVLAVVLPGALSVGVAIKAKGE